jgi:hypothetical protein
MLSGRVSAPLNRAFIGVTTLTFKKQLDAFSSAQAADWSNVSRHKNLQAVQIT